MRVDDLQAELRARTPWEAVDLGVAMTRRWWRPLWAAWLALVVPAQLLLFLVLRAHPFLAAALAWWLLPLWERVALFVLSRCLFGVRPTVGQVAAGLWGTVLAGLAGDLGLRRLSPTRTVVLPVSQLEHLGGWRARQRRRVLGVEVTRIGSGLALASAVLEGAVLSGLLVLVSWILPEGPRWSAEVLLDDLVGGAWWAPIAVASAVILVTGAVQPLRVGACFGLYLQRRTLLEGWDVELTFRRLAERLARRAAGVAALLLGLGLALAAGPALAQPAGGPAAAPAGDAEVREVTAQVMAGEEFGGTRTVERWKLRFELPEAELEPRDSAFRLDGLGQVFQVLLAALVGVALVGLVLSMLARSPVELSPDQAARPLAATRSGLLALDGSPLPEHPAQAAWALWQQGQQDAALSLLYRAAVAHLVHHRHLEVDDSATEGDCLRAARRTLPARPAAYLGRLTHAWQRRAYGHRPVEDAEMRALVEAWGELDAGALA